MVVWLFNEDTTLQVVEMAYQKTKQFEKLSFLYLITGKRFILSFSTYNICD